MCSFLKDVFGVATAAQIDIDKTKLIERDNPTSKYVDLLIELVLKFLLPGEFVTFTEQ